jgi:hypothetical protein
MANHDQRLSRLEGKLTVPPRRTREQVQRAVARGDMYWQSLPDEELYLFLDFLTRYIPTDAELERIVEASNGKPSN